MRINRLIIYLKDVQRITGKSARYSRQLLDRIRERKSKTKQQFVSINEFAEFTGLSMKEVASYLLNRNNISLLIRYANDFLDL